MIFKYNDIIGELRISGVPEQMWFSNWRASCGDGELCCSNLGQILNNSKGNLLFNLCVLLSVLRELHIYAEKKAALFIPDHNGDSVHRGRRGGLKPNSESQKW